MELVGLSRAPPTTLRLQLFDGLDERQPASAEDATVEATLVKTPSRLVGKKARTAATTAVPAERAAAAELYGAAGERCSA